MATTRIPERLWRASRVSSHHDFRAWIDSLPDTISGVADGWDLELEMPFEPGGQCAWVAPALDRSGRRLVLKIGWRHIEAENEAEALRLWGGSGAVELIDYQERRESNVLLLERCDPGTSLSALLTEPERDPVIADLLKRLWQAPVNGSPFRPLWQMCDRWADELDANVNSDVDPTCVNKASELLRSLPRDPTKQVLLFTDLHGDNVLAATREPWLVIDPKPHVGDPAYDVVQHIGTSYSRIQAAPAALAARMSALADVDEQRVRLWLFCRAVQERPGKPWLQQAIDELAP